MREDMLEVCTGHTQRRGKQLKKERLHNIASVTYLKRLQDALREGIWKCCWQFLQPGADGFVLIKPDRQVARHRHVQWVALNDLLYRLRLDLSILLLTPSLSGRLIAR